MAVLSEQERQARKVAAGFDPQTVILGNVSRIVPWKGHEYALQVLSEIKRDFAQIKLVIVGDAKTPSEHAYKKTLIKTMMELGLEENVIFTGWQKDPASFYAIFDIYLLTSMPFEGVPGSIIEAVVAGLPVVGFDCYGLREIPGIYARLVPTKDLQALSANLKDEIAHLAQIRHRYRKSPDELDPLQQQFSMASMVKETSKLCQDLLSDNGNGHRANT
jgi:glycosyltransferase involved in cell wall biosynthesis